mgnify:CR=1 FL=1|jgi:hypothetical protein
MAVLRNDPNKAYINLTSISLLFNIKAAIAVSGRWFTSLYSFQFLLGLAAVFHVPQSSD